MRHLTLALLFTAVIARPARADERTGQRALLPKAAAERLQSAFHHLSNGELLHVAKNDHAETVANLGRGLIETFPDNEHMPTAVAKANMRALLTPAANREAILEIGRRGLTDAIPMLIDVASGKLKIVEGGAVIRPFSMARGAINSPRDAAIVALGTMGGKEPIAALSEMVRSRNASPLAADALVAAAGEEARGVLREVADRGEWHTRWSMLRRLATLGDEKALGELARGFNGGSAVDRESAFFELANLGLPILTRVLHLHGDPEVRLAAIRTLGGLPDQGIDRSPFKADLQWAASHDTAASNRAKAIKMVGQLYGRDAIVEALAPVATGDQRPNLERLATEAMSHDYQTAARARAGLAELATSR
jgi:hypothetical protein